MYLFNTINKLLYCPKREIKLYLEYIIFRGSITSKFIDFWVYLSKVHRKEVILYVSY
jgi:hypothetical protein